MTAARRLVECPAARMSVEAVRSQVLAKAHRCDDAQMPYIADRLIHVLPRQASTLPDWPAHRVEALLELGVGEAVRDDGADVQADWSITVILYHVSYISRP